MAELSLDEFSGTQPGSSSSSAQRKSSLSPTEFAGAGEDDLSPAALQRDNIKQTLFGSDAGQMSASQIALSSLKKIGGEGAALADFVLGLPGFMLGTGAQIGGTVQAAARGVPLSADQRQLNPVTAFSVGRQAGQEFSEPFSNPVQKLLNMFDSGEAYKHAATTKGMEKLMQGVEHAGEWVEHASGGRISRDSIPMLVDTVMASATGVRGGSDIGKLDPELVKRVRKEAGDLATSMREKADNEAAANTLSPEEFAVRAPVQQQINEMLGIRTPQEQAKLIRQRRADVKSAFRSPEEGGDYGSIDESQFRADERLSNEDAYAKESERLRLGGEPYEVGSKERPGRIGQAEILKIMQKPGYERTADDLITLRAARKQEGKMDSPTAALLAAAGLGTAAALSDDDLRDAVVKGVTKASDFIAPAGVVGAMFLPAMHGSHGVKIAEKLETAGKSREDIWKETGLFRGKDKVWREEISDNTASLLEDLEKNPYNKSLITPVSLFKSKKLSEIIKHPELYRRFPELKDADVKSTGFNFGVSGAYDEAKNSFYLSGGDPDAVRSTLLHEVQHYIQGKGNMARGGSPSQFLKPEIAEMRKATRDKLKELTSKDEGYKQMNSFTVASALEKERKGEELHAYEKEALQKANTLQDFHEVAKLILRDRAFSKLEDYGYKQYRRLGGEVEARAVQERRDMTPEQRKETPPWKSFDVPEEDFLIKHTVGNSGDIKIPEESTDKNLESVKAPLIEKGFIDQKLVVGLSSLGLGAAVGGYLSQDKGTGALLGALAGAAVMLPGAKARLKMIADTADYGLGALSTRIGNISPALKLRGREYERNVLTEAHAELHKVVPFMQELEKVGGAKKQELYKAILTNDKERIAQLMQGNTPLVAAWRETRNVLNDLGERLQGHGRFKTMLDDYFPRLVKDKDALLAALDVAQRTRLETALADAEKSSMKNRGTPLSDVETSSIINREIQGFRRAKGYQPGFAKQRGVEEITDKLLPFYFTPAESLFSYIRGAVQDLEMAKFFGKDLQQTKLGGQQHINIEGSVGNLVGSELKAGRIDAKQAEQLIGMLQSRFQGGERASSRLVQEARNLGNMGLIGNVVSAVTQGADTSMAIYSQGFRPFLSAIAKQMIGREKITTADFGLADHIAEEFISRTKTADWLNKMFKYSGFSAIDRFGKNTLLAAAHEKATTQSMTPKGVEQLKAKYGEAFGGDFPRLVSDLKSGKLTPAVRALLFSELSDMQPVSKLEMPQAYLDNPNGRLIYMLKTFMLKQMDVIRRDTYNELKKGNVAKGLYNLTAYGLTLGIAGATTQMVQDWMMGREVKFGATDVLENALKTFGWSAYVRDKAAKGHPMEAVAGMVAPPYKMIDDIVRRDPRAVQYIPLIGKLFYAWELGGKEEAEIRDKRGTERELSERALDYRAKKREAARDKKQ